MGKIKTLDPHVADLIAAGEVVERPGSAVKELLENAIDAGAETVTVEIINGGMRSIRVTDDGCGIPAGDAATAFLRHATSKIATEYDLERIGTLGFRGEALAAISAVSRVDLLTRTADAKTGVALSLEGGVPGETEPAGCPVGTTIVVKDLFFNTPARMKFIKKDTAEGVYVSGIVQKIALSHPEVSIKLIRDGKEELHTPGDTKLSSAVYSVLGRDFAKGMVEAKGSWEELSVSGFVSRPDCCRGTRGHQYFFINGRFVKSRTMAAALEEAYRNQKMKGKFPASVLHIAVKPSLVDVNVHPTKTEVKFVREKQLFDAVYYTVRAALEQNAARPLAKVAAARPDAVSRPWGETAGDSQAERQAHPSRSGPPVPQEGETDVPPKAVPSREKAEWMTLADETCIPYGDGNGAVLPPSIPAAGIAAPGQRFSPDPVRPGEAAVPKGEPGPGREAESQPEKETVREAREVPWRMIGEAFDTYVLVEQGDRLLMIDKHAAHERIQFDRLKAEGYVPMSQQLLTPLVFTPPGEEGGALLQNRELLSRFGFEVADFGGGSLVVRRVPFDIEPGETEEVLSQLAGVLLNGGRADPHSFRDALLATIACKSAVKGGQKNGEEELKRIAEEVLSGNIRFCPHGRPVALELSRRDLEKQIKRG
ncbi:MAG: DNA mismatch repair endonuclease MutL [Oscillospiraceae bacterium]|nr:DNA mismatch repair endonuclease MutL [Oscillospiraceae bacterium]